MKNVEIDILKTFLKNFSDIDTEEKLISYGDEVRISYNIKKIEIGIYYFELFFSEKNFFNSFIKFTETEIYTVYIDKPISRYIVNTNSVDYKNFDIIKINKGFKNSVAKEPRLIAEEKASCYDFDQILYLIEVFSDYLFNKSKNRINYLVDKSLKKEVINSLGILRSKMRRRKLNLKIYENQKRLKKELEGDLIDR